MLKAKLACGPMSPEIIEAVFRHSHRYDEQLMLICSRNQIDQYNGYVFTTKKYMDYIAKMRSRYVQANVLICRDHCGPGFGAPDNTLDSVRDTIRCDLECGFDLIHIDLCHLSIPHVEKMQKTLQLMEFARGIRSDVMFEIGTDENVGVAETDVNRITADIQTCQEVANPVFYVVQTGSLVREAYQAGSFRTDAVRLMKKVLHKCGTRLKEHNADYLSANQIAYRKDVVDAVNIAPQLGVIQTNYILSQALIYGIDTKPFIDEVVGGGKWRKWVDGSTNYQLYALIAGHYHFGGPAYKRLTEQLALRTNVVENVICDIIKVIEHYLFALE